MSDFIRLLEFSLEDQQYALYFDAVDRVVQSVEITPLPTALESVLGVVNVQGQVFPVLNIRKRFGIPDKEIDLTDHLIIARTMRRTVILLVDSVKGVTEHSKAEISDSEKIVPGMEYIEGIVKFEAGMILIHDLDKFLSLDEEKALSDAMQED